MIITHSVPPPVGCTSPWLPALPEPAHLLEVKPAVGCFSSCNLNIIKMVMIMINVLMIRVKMVMIRIKMVMIRIRFLIKHPLSAPHLHHSTCLSKAFSQNLRPQNSHAL